MLMKSIRRMIFASSFFALCGFVQADEISDEPKIVPVTRDEVKEALDRLKYRKPRFPRREGEGERGRNRERNREGANREGGDRQRRGGGGGGLSRGDDPV